MHKELKIFNQANDKIAYFDNCLNSHKTSVMLHGFPDCPDNWLVIAEKLALSGYRVVLPYLPGYAPSGTSFKSYLFQDLAYEISKLIQEITTQELYLIGHDWGALIAYEIANNQEVNINKLVGISVPPLNVMTSALFRYNQLKLSWYMFFFQTPFAETVVAQNDFEFIKNLYSDWSVNKDKTAAQNAIKCLQQSANLNAALSYYRELFKIENLTKTLSQLLEKPLYYLHGSLDGCISKDSIFDLSHNLPAGSKVEFLENAGHFLNIDCPDLLAEKIIHYLNS